MKTRTINFTDEDIKKCKLSLVSQNLDSLQSAFLMQYIINLEATITKAHIFINEKVYFDLDANVEVLAGEDIDELVKILEEK